MKKENAYDLMDELLSLEYDLDSMRSLSLLLLHALQEDPAAPAGYLLHCYDIWLCEMRRKLRSAIELLDEAIVS